MEEVEFIITPLMRDFHELITVMHRLQRLEKCKTRNVQNSSVK